MEKKKKTSEWKKRKKRYEEIHEYYHGCIKHTIYYTSPLYIKNNIELKFCTTRMYISFTLMALNT